MSHTLTKVRDLTGTGKWRGDAGLYTITPPVQWRDWDNETMQDANYVVVSAVDFTYDHGDSETMIFPALDNGDLADWGELACTRGTADHAEATTDAGWTLAPSPAEVSS